MPCPLFRCSQGTPPHPKSRTQFYSGLNPNFRIFAACARNGRDHCLPGYCNPRICVLFCLYNVRKIDCMNNRFLGVDGSKLRRFRRERAMSLRDLGERSGVAFDTINRLELGKQEAQPRTLRALAKVLGVEPAELVKGEE